MSHKSSTSKRLLIPSRSPNTNERSQGQKPCHMEYRPTMNVPNTHSKSKVSKIYAKFIFGSETDQYINEDDIKISTMLNQNINGKRTKPFIKKLSFSTRAIRRVFSNDFRNYNMLFIESENSRVMWPPYKIIAEGRFIEKGPVLVHGQERFHNILFRVESIEITKNLQTRYFTIEKTNTILLCQSDHSYQFQTMKNYQLEINQLNIMLHELIHELGISQRNFLNLITKITKVG